MGEGMVARSLKDTDELDSGFEEPPVKEALAPRSYQLEMVKESMRRNIIIAMDTGSGKTLIATLRIQAELETCHPDKLVWFCVPTVALANQQYQAISTQLPAYEARVLSGLDNCEFWNKKTWTEVLRGTRIVISTHKILLDALVHAFVNINQIALLVFDEAHRATKDHPANGIMKRFYHPAEDGDKPVILGLTASPLTNNNIGNLSVLETNLNAISRTPKLHRSELIKSVYKPELVKLVYTLSASDPQHIPKEFQDLEGIYYSYDLNKDPWIVKMRSDPKTRSSSPLQKAIIKQKTWCREQLRGFYERSKYIMNELGPWATSIYIVQCIKKYQSNKGTSFTIEETISDQEKLHLQALLDQVHISNALDEDFNSGNVRITPKLELLVNFLKGEESVDFAGLIFVKTRAETAVLSQLLTRHPVTQSFSTGTFVGESGSSSRKFALCELADARGQKNTLDDLRQGRRNLIIATDALEEGIDVSACNIVICFDKPANLKSFVQRRGRARKEVSTYAIMVDENLDPNAMSKLQELEDMMKTLYEDEMRELEQIKQLESEEATGHREFTVEETGATLSLSDAVSHLYHFCSTLPPDPYVDRAPVFFFKDLAPQGSDRLISARVLLPCSVDISVREANSKDSWTTEKNAKRDAAFEAYVALYHAGLIDDHLLPLGRVDPQEEEAYAVVEKRPNLVEVSDQIQAWPNVASAWSKVSELHQTSITLCLGLQEVIKVRMLLPISTPVIDEFPLYWDAKTTYTVCFKPQVPTSPVESLSAYKAETLLFLQTVFQNRMNHALNDFVALFMTSGLESRDITKWNARRPISDKQDESDEMFQDKDILNIGLIRDLKHCESPHIFQLTCRVPHQTALQMDLLDARQKEQASYLCLEVQKFPKRADFLHAVAKSKVASQTKSAKRLLLAEACEVDNLPMKYSLFASFIPSILHNIQKALVVDQLCSTILSSSDLQDRGLVATAISASSAREATDYQRLEFLGDSILKLMTSTVLMTQNPKSHEGILSHMKDHIVSNSSLSSAAIRVGLDRFILTKAFTGRKWRPLYNSELLRDKEERRREMSTKTLADVVESLIGAAILDGGMQKVIKCLGIFLPKLPWPTVTKADKTLYESYDRSIVESAHMTHVQKILGYHFNRKPLLLEAITHASYRGANIGAPYERLEFLGDSLLDNIVTRKAFHNDPPIPTPRLHLIRVTLVNANFLGYLCISLSGVVGHRAEVDAHDPNNISISTTEVFFALWQSMYHSSPAIPAAQQACLARYVMLKDEIARSLATGMRYPWTLLARLEPPKFVSDIIESLLGAIWIDSRGARGSASNEDELFLDRLGLIPYLTRVIENEDIALLHPKEELGQLADQDKIQYITDVEGEDRGDKNLTCEVMMGERQVVKVRDGLSRMEVETRAADEACQVLRQEGRRLGKGRNKVQVDEEENENDDDAHDIGDVEPAADLALGDKEDTDYAIGKKRKADDDYDADDVMSD